MYMMIQHKYHLLHANDHLSPHKKLHIFPLFKVMTWCLKNILQHGHKSARRREASWIFYCIFWCFSCLFLLVSSSCFCNLEVGCFPQLLLLHFYCAPKRKAISSVLFPSSEAKSLSHSDSDFRHFCVLMIDTRDGTPCAGGQNFFMTGARNLILLLFHIPGRQKV